MPDDVLQELRREHVISELADVFGMDQESQVLLESIGFPRGRLPQGSPSAEDFWNNASRLVASGLVSGGLSSLLTAARERFPFNPVFSHWATELANRQAPGISVLASPPVPVSQRAESGAHLYLIVTGYGADVYGTMDRVREYARALGLNVPLEIGWANQESIQFRIYGASEDQVLALGRELEGGENGLRTTFSRTNFEDYLFRRLLVEGPDQARFELTNIPASTTVKDIARAIVSEYQDSAWPRDRSGQARPAVIDHQSPDGTTQRLEPQETLHESGVQDGDTLHMAPESTAGSVNPQFREEHLARARAQVLSYAGEHPGFEVFANAAVAPTEYVFRFREPSWGPPPGPGEPPVPIDRHEVLVILPSDFPVVAPKAFWQSEIFHPNVDPRYGKVCLGVLEDRYRPGLDFGDLCQVLVDMAAYRNYETREGYNMEAQRWAVSPEGQGAIEERGGRSVTRQFLGRLEEMFVRPLPIQIRRRDQ